MMARFAFPPTHPATHPATHPPPPTRVDDEWLLAWLILHDAGWPVALLASVCGVAPYFVRRCMADVRREDAAAHRPPRAAARRAVFGVPA